MTTPPQAGESRVAIDELTYAISHDLRAPLRAVLGYAAALDEDYGAGLDDEGRRLLAIVSDEASRAMRMLDALLDLSTLERSAIVAEPIDMTELSRAIAIEILPLRDERVTIEVLPDAHGDPALIRAVWTHLLANAVTATDGRANARVTISGVVEGDRIVYGVSDNGIGFDMKYATKLFRPFAKLHHTDVFPGVGTGLATVARIVARHGGTVWADARANDGATFSFALPSVART